MLKIGTQLFINEAEIKFSFIRSPGPGGQNVNKVATAVQLRFNVRTASTLSEEIRARLLRVLQSKLTQDGELIVKASRYRSQERNKQDALQRFINLLNHAATIPKKRKASRPSFVSVKKRLDEKKRHAKNKKLRQKHFEE